MNWKMKSYKIRISRVVMVSLCCLFACQETSDNSSRVDILPYYNEASFTPRWIHPHDAALDTFHRIPPFRLVNQEGHEITEKDFEGKVYVADFFFTTCPGICPKMTANMMDLQEEFLNDEDVLLLSHSVTPESDSVPVLQSYAEDRGIDAKRWHLATGDQQEIYSLGRREYFAEEDLGIEKEDDEFLHTENFVLIDHDRHIRGIYNGLNKTSVKQLISDIKTLKMER